MNKIINFVKEILLLEQNEKMPIGLCQFECVKEAAAPAKKTRKKKEMRLSELMDK